MTSLVSKSSVSSFLFLGTPDSFCLPLGHSPQFPHLRSYFGWERKGASFVLWEEYGRQVSRLHPGSLLKPHQTQATRPPLSLVSRPSVLASHCLCIFALVLPPSPIPSSLASPNPTWPNVNPFHLETLPEWSQPTSTSTLPSLLSHTVATPCGSWFCCFPQVISTTEHPLRFCELLQSCLLLELIQTCKESHMLTGRGG